jgi:PAS domain S-box-containing protein
MANGYDGLRLSGNTFWLEKTDWDNFADYEEEIDSIIGNCNMMALCTYSIDRCNATEILDVVVNHQFALIKRDRKWEKIVSLECKRAEEALQESEKRFRILTENSPDLIARFDRQNRHLYVNPAVVKGYGRSQEEIIGKTHRELGVDPEKVKFLEEHHQKVFATGKPGTMEFQYTSTQGKRYYFNTLTVPEFVDGEIVSLLDISRDITDMKETEARLKETLENLEELVEERTAELEKSYNSLKESERSLAEAQKMAHIGNWDLNLVTGESYWSEEAYRIFGHEINKNNIKFDEFLSYIHPDDRDYVDKTIKNRLKGSHQSIDYRIILADREERTIHDEAEVIFDEKNVPIRARGIIQDITELKKSEEKIQTLANAVESSNDAIGTISLDGVITSWNKEAEQVYGYSAEEILGKPAATLMPFSFNDETKALSEIIKKGGRIRNYETSRIRKDGRIIDCAITLSPVFDSYGKLTAISVVARDITRSKKAEQALKLSEERYRTIIECTGQLVYDYDIEKNTVYWEGNIKEFTGYDPEEFRNMSHKSRMSRVHPEDLDRLKNNIKRHMKYGGVYCSEYRCKEKNGSYIFVEDNGVCLKNEKGKVNRVLGTIKDVTERKLSQERLEVNERKYRSFIENFKGIVYQTDENLITHFLHGAVKEITGYSEEEFMSELPWKEIIDPEHLSIISNKGTNLRDAPGARTVEREFRISNRNGKTKWVHETGQKIFGENGKPIYQGVIYDITERKQAEEALANIEAARKKETHHRIKNNLQIISSLLDLEAEKFKNRESVQDSEFLEAFRESQNRVLSIALIHEELHKGKANDTLNFSPYLRKLVKNLFQTYRLGDANVSLNIEIEENILFNMDTAVTLGLIVNELVSNSLKYAFPERNGGEVRIKLYREKIGECKDEKTGSKKEDLKNTSFVLEVSDDGIGIPESLDLENLDSLGIQLIITLVDQLDGKLQLKRDYGTEFVISFTVEEKQ